MPIGPVFTGDGGGDGIINLGGLPGIQQGPIASRPAAGVADGVWYLATEPTKILYRWDLGSGIWIEQLNDGSGGSSDWQTVMAAGNTSNRVAILKNNPANDNIGAFGDAFGFGSGGWAITSPGDYPVTSSSRTLLAYVFAAVSSPEGRIALEFYNGPDGDVDGTYLLHRINTARRNIILPDKSGEPLLGASDLYSTTLYNGQTTIGIPHGMFAFPLLPTTPSNVCINATDPTTLTVLSGGYYLTYNNVTFIINLTVPVVGTPTVNISWTAFV